MNTRSALVTATLLEAAMPSWGQTAGPAAGPLDAGAQSAALIPDFSGIWARLSFPGFEPLASGPTSLVNRSRSPNGRWAKSLSV